MIIRNLLVVGVRRGVLEIFEVRLFVLLDTKKNFYGFCVCVVVGVGVGYVDCFGYREYYL